MMRLEVVLVMVADDSDKEFLRDLARDARVLRLRRCHCRESTPSLHDHCRRGLLDCVGLFYFQYTTPSAASSGSAPSLV